MKSVPKIDSLSARWALWFDAQIASYKICVIYKKLIEITNKPKKVKIQIKHVPTCRLIFDLPSSGHHTWRTTAAQPKFSTLDSTSKVLNEFKILLTL